MNTLYRFLCIAQGLYFLLTGVWPLISIRTFQQVTGPKTDNLPTGLEADHWLVNAVAGLIMAIGGTLLAFGIRRQQPRGEAAILGIAAAAGLTAIDVVYVTRRVISPIYLVDAAVEVCLIILWLIWAVNGTRQSPPG